MTALYYCRVFRLFSLQENSGVRTALTSPFFAVTPPHVVQFITLHGPWPPCTHPGSVAQQGFLAALGQVIQVPHLDDIVPSPTEQEASVTDQAEHTASMASTQGDIIKDVLQRVYGWSSTHWEQKTLSCSMY